jgi:SWI/SNF-related matrix-associated actin-dependent regulator 1 of chromatin subfamily A
VADFLRDSDEKVIVFGHHTAALAHVADKLPGAARLFGNQDAGVQTSNLHLFLHGDARVLVANVRRGGVGLNLQVASRVIFLEADWTPAINEQAIARAHRSGQQKPVHVSFVSLHNSIDDDVTRALARKSKIINKITG